jgi:hypothetical protein
MADDNKKNEGGKAANPWRNLFGTVTFTAATASTYGKPGERQSRKVASVQIENKVVKGAYFLGKIDAVLTPGVKKARAEFRLIGGRQGDCLRIDDPHSSRMFDEFASEIETQYAEWRKTGGANVEQAAVELDDITL